MLKIVSILLTALFASMNIANAQTNDKSRIIRCDTPAMDRLGLLESSVSYWSKDDFTCWEEIDGVAVFTVAEADGDRYYQLRQELRLENSDYMWTNRVAEINPDSFPTEHDGLIWYVENYQWDEEGEEAFCFQALAESPNKAKRQYIDFCEYGRIMEFDEATVLTRLPGNPF